MRALPRWSVSVGLMLTLVATGATAATAAPAETPAVDAGSGSVSSVARTADGRAVTSASVARDIEAYWTPERMAAAVDITDLKPAKADAGRKAPDVKGPAGSIAPAQSLLAGRGDDAHLMLNESQTVGKVYFTLPNGQPSGCSASAVNSGKRRLVMTAGHCVHQGYAGGSWYSNWVFVPRYRNGSRPYGTFSAYTLTSRTAWVNNGSYDEDMGIAIMNSGGIYGWKVGETVGGNGLRWNWGYNVPWITALGYPSNLGGGESQYYCQSGTWHGHDQVIRMYCNMTYGSSGGPWLQDYNDQNGLGYINSVVSHGDNPGNGEFDGPYFDNDIKSLFDYAEGLSPA